MTMHISNEEEFKQEVLNAESPVLVDFYSDECRPCMAMMPVLEELSKERDLKVVKIDVYEPSVHKLVQQHGIRSIPAMFIYNKGQQVDSFVGTIDKNSLSNKIPA